MRNFNIYFYIEVLWLVFSMVESASAQLHNAQLNIFKPQDIIAFAKASITSARNDARFDSAWSGILSATEAKAVIDEPELSRPRKVSRRLDEPSNAFFMQKPKIIIIDSYITKCWIP